MEKWIVSRSLGRALGQASLALWVSRAEPPARGATSDGALGVAETPTAWRVENDSHAGQFGYSLAAGDVNGDGFCDVVVGARVHPEPHWRGGRAFLFAGAAGGLQVTPVWSAAGAVAEERFGEAVACGDVNGDGFADVLVGSWMHGNRRGAVWLYLGSRDGLVRSQPEDRSPHRHGAGAGLSWGPGRPVG